MKIQLRQQVRLLVRGIAAEERARLSAQACDQLRHQPLWTLARSILFYSPLSDEPDIGASMDAALREGKQVRLPRYDEQRGTYCAREIQDRNVLNTGKFGILEPADSCAVIPLNQLDLVLVPGIAFDFAGRRLGRGKGFYDRLLAEVQGHKCGVCFDQQIVPNVPEEPHDIRLDSILTPTRWHPCKRAA